MSRALPILLLLLLGSSVAAAGERSPSEPEAWLTHYYLDPRPAEVAQVLRTLTDSGVIDSQDAQAPLSGFFAEVFKANPDRIDGWIEPYLGMPGRHVLYSALWMANVPESRAALKKFEERSPDEDGALLEELLKTAPPTSKTMEIDSPAALDYLWGAFMATGSDVPVRRVIDQMRFAETKGNTGLLLIGGAARWSVSANARQHPRVLQILRESEAGADAKTAEAIHRVLEAMEEEASHGP